MDDLQKIKDSINDHEQRISKLEKLFEKKDVVQQLVNEGKKYSGLSGGIDFLIENRFFDNPKTANEVYLELQKEGYYTTLQSADAALRKSFVARKKKLTRIKDDNDVWKYVIRK